MVHFKDIVSNVSTVWSILRIMLGSWCSLEIPRPFYLDVLPDSMLKRGLTDSHRLNLLIDLRLCVVLSGTDI